MLPEFTFTLPAGFDVSRAVDAAERSKYATTSAVAYAALRGEEMAPHLMATNGRILAILPVNGEAPLKPVLVPRKAVKALANSAATISVNGEVRVTTGTRTKKTAIMDNAPQEGRFPAVRSVVPKSIDGYTRLVIDAKLLADLAAAISGPSGVVCLYLPPTESGVVDSPIVAIGRDGVNGGKINGMGMIVPLSTATHRLESAVSEEKEAFRAAVDSLPLGHLSFGQD